MKDADALYESISGRWAALRSDAFALLRYADTAGEAKRGPVMRGSCCISTIYIQTGLKLRSC